jgi:transcriptional regulator with XRE-family HTH domain
MKRNSLPPSATQAIQKLGENLQVARKRRGITMEEMASRMFVSRQTLARLEKGEPGVALGVLSSALWVLGLHDQIRELAAPERDEIGAFRERQKLPQRVRASGRSDELDF